MPVDWMLAVLRDPEAEQNRRDLMAIQSAPYLHAKLNAVAVSTHGNGNSRDNGTTNILQIYAVPRGARIEKDGTGAITIEGAAVELQPIEPFVGTPALTDQRDQHERAEPERERFEVHELEPPPNVSRLDTFRNRRDSEDEGGPGAA